jgi:hypothetical protein
MIDLLLDVPAHHAYEFQEILANAEINYTIHKRPDSNPGDPVLFEIITTSEKGAFAEKLLADMDTYSAVTFVTHKNIDETLRRAESLSLEVVSNTVAFRILDRPYLHRLEVKGSELALGRFYSKTKLPDSNFEVKSATHIFVTASRGGSGKGTVAHIKSPDPVKS